ncbi:hypothetical protein KI387_032962, partial [Taxus chinensis]
MASSSSSQEHQAFSGIEPPGIRRKVDESSRLFDVFINHRGPDVKDTLATQLYNSLQQFGIRAFLDSKEKELGDSIFSTIETAIGSAAVHIAIFSKNYAQSPWCLAELVLMLQSRAKIIPVFYDVHPRELRHIEKGVYAEAFIDYENKCRYLEKLKEWKEALQCVSFITGEEFNSDSENIVKAVRTEVERSNSKLHVAKYPVELHKLVHDFESHSGLNKGGEEKAQIIGIFGMGGIGKTTLSKELFNRKRSQYRRMSFVFDVREASTKRDLPSLQLKLLKDLFNEDRPSFQSIDEGKKCIGNCIGRSSVLSLLIVLDDIDHVEQLDALMVMDILNKPGNSLVIVTTRDVGVLVRAGITIGYDLKGMDRDAARELFCWHAFRQPHPASGYNDLVEAFLNGCGGLPLSLQVLGTHVHDRDQNYWKLELNKIKKMLPRDIQQRLKISIDSLDNEEKQIFVDIACFFVNQNKNMSLRIWEGSEWNAEHALQTLKDKCLVEEIFDWENRIDLRMHDHLRDLGREMAIEMSPPQRVWHPQHIKSLCLIIKNADLIKLWQSDVQEPSSLKELQIIDTILGEFPALSGISNHLEEVVLNGEDIPIEWWSFLDSVTTIPAVTTRYGRRKFVIFESSSSSVRLDSFQFSGVVALNNRGLCPSVKSPMSKLRKVLFHRQELVTNLAISRYHYRNLESLHLRCLQNLSEVDLNMVTTLKSFNLISCTSLKSVSRICHLTKLVKSKIRGCSELKTFAGLSHLSFLKTIRIETCEKLECLELDDCENLKVVYVSDLPKLTNLSIRNCPKFKKLSDLWRLSSLEQITIDGCGKVKLFALRIIGCPKVESLPTTLTHLKVEGQNEWKAVPAISDLTELKSLVITECEELQELSVAELRLLETITIVRCEKLQNIAGIEELFSLKAMEISLCSNGAIRSSIDKLQRLPSEQMIAIGSAAEGAELKLGPHLFSEWIAAEQVIQLEDNLVETMADGDSLDAIIYCAVVVPGSFPVQQIESVSLPGESDISSSPEEIASTCSPEEIVPVSSLMEVDSCFSPEMIDSPEEIVRAEL